VWVGDERGTIIREVCPKPLACRRKSGLQGSFRPGLRAEMQVLQAENRGQPVPTHALYFADGSAATSPN
jgi:hypothetical protein